MTTTITFSSLFHMIMQVAFAMYHLVDDGRNLMMENGRVNKRFVGRGLINIVHKLAFDWYQKTYSNTI